MNDKLDKLRASAAQARDYEAQLADLASQSKEISAKLHALYHETLPGLLDDAGLDHIGVPPEGNKPGVDYEMKPFYSASIAAKWPQEKKDAAFALLKRLKAEPLIKTEVSAKLPKGNLGAAKKILAQIKKLKIKGAKIDLKQSVHQGTLTAWLREIYEDRGQSLSAPDLEKIAGKVGRYVKAKDRKDESDEEE